MWTPTLPDCSMMYALILKELIPFDRLQFDAHFLILIIYGFAAPDSCKVELRESFTVPGYFWV